MHGPSESLAQFLDWVQYQWGWAWLGGGVWLFLLIVFLLACVTAPKDTEIWGVDPDTMPLPRGHLDD